MNVNQVGRVIIPVNDQQKAVDFYCDTLGFEKRVDVPMGGDYRWIEVGPKGGTTTIAVVNPPEGQQAGGRETGITLDTTDIDADHAELKAKGVDVDDEVSRMGDPVPPMFWLRDPEQNTLLIVQPSRP
jgi:predicted enzyme related to lactoylglutathione lyase